MDVNGVREFINKQTWIYAKTYANKAPHEYIVRGRISGTDEEFLAVIDYIQENGIIMHYWGHPNRYIFLDRQQYWVMRNDENDPTAILNRCNVDEYKYTVAWNGGKESR